MERQVMMAVQRIRTGAVCLAAAVFAWSGNGAHACPASPHPITARQPDGTEITLYLRGTFEFHWYEDAEGYTVVESAGAYYYAQLDERGNLAATKWLVGKSDLARTQLTPHLLPPLENRPSPYAQFNPGNGGDDGGPATLIQGGGAIGTFKNVVILMRFSNHVGRPLPSVPDMDVLFNHVGPHATLAPTGSVRDIYLENSYGLLTLNSTVFAWVTLPNTEAYYANGNAGRDSKFWEAIQDALLLADPLIDFNQFDDNNNDIVDAIAFIHSGYGAEWGGTDCFGANYLDRIWSHRWSIPTWTSAEGVRVSDYHVSPGLWGTCGSAIGRVGVIAHETGHFFGLPDLYDTNGGSSGIGSWCMMANSWGFDGSQLHPPHFSAWCKKNLGWVNPTVISPGAYNIPRVQTSPVIYRIDFGYPSGEYLLLENRQPFGFENIIPQGGLFIWHIDDLKGSNTAEGFPGQPGWPENNNHYMVALLQADGNYNLERGQNSGDSGDPYRAPFATLIGNTTVPNTHRYQGGNVGPTGNTITDISASSANMSFTYTRPNFDCNLNGYEDADDIAIAFSPDCNANGKPDECEIHVSSLAGGGPYYCVSNCDPDCNLTGVPDECELAANDCNGDLRPDECGVLTSCQLDGFTGDDTDAASRFGSALSVFGSRMIVGDESNDTLGSGAGAAYAFERAGGGWSAYGPKLLGSDTVAGDEFGCSAAVFLSVAAVGARSHSHGGFSLNGAVYAFADTGSGWTEYQKVVPLDPGTTDRFGHAVSMDGDTLAVGAPGKGGKGAVYLFKRAGGLTWTQEVKLLAWDGLAGDDFGEFVSLRNDTLVVSARGRDELGTNAGTAYVFIYNGANWQGLQKLLPSDALPGDQFGRCAGLFPLITCGSPDADLGGADAGRAYVFRYNLGTQLYQQEAVLTPSSHAPGDRFGSAVATGSGFVAVGSESASPGGVGAGGTVTVFQYVNPAWVEFLTVAAPDVTAGDQFGARLNPVFIGDRIWAAAPAESGARFGHVYEYAIGGADCNCNAAGDSCDIALGAPDANGNGIPDECENLDCNNNGINDAVDLQMGTSFDCDGNGRPDECDIATVSTAPGGPFFCVEHCDADCDNSGIPDACELAANDCNADGLHDACGIAIACDDTELARLVAADAAPSDNFGAGVDVSGNAIISGANWDDCTAGADCGSAYVYRRTAGVWSPEQKLTASDAAAADNFGRSVAISGDLAAVGAFADDCGAGADCGSVYVFRRQGGTWVQQQKLTAADAVAADVLGLPVAAEGDFVAAGASGVDCFAGSNCGAVYVFRYNGVNWVQDAKLSAADAAANDGFGQAVALHGDLLVVGSPADDCGAGVDCGAAYIFRRIAGVWQQEKKLTAFDAGASDNFGTTVAVSDGVVAVGSPRDDCSPGVVDCGATYVFRYVSGTWISEAKLVPSDVAANDQFGRAVDLDGSVLVASSWLSDCGAGVNCGSMYVFRHNGAAWIEEQKLMSATPVANDNFGGAVALDGDTAVSGATFFDCFAGSNCGAAFVYALRGEDCNCNLTADRCDIALGAEPDVNANGIPDSCEVSAPLPAAPPHDWRKNRYISFTPNSGASSVAFRVDKVTFPFGSCWVSAPDGAGRARCEPAPTLRAWPEGTVHVGDCEIVPVAAYEVRASPDGVLVTPPLSVETIAQPGPKFWGDLVGINTGIAWTPPNQITNVQDVVAMVNYITGAGVAPPFEVVNLASISAGDPCLNQLVNTADVLQVVRASAGDPYPFLTSPGACPVCP